MSTISASTTTTTAYKVTADTTGTLVLQTGAAPTTAVTIDGSQNVTLAGNITLNNGTADGAQLVLQSSGFSDWNIDNYSGNFRWYYNTTEYMRLTNTGNLGLGVTPSAWATFTNVLQNQGGAIASSSANNIRVFQNSYYNGTNYIYKTTEAASRYDQQQGAHYWFNAPSGTAGNPITFTQAMTLDASGNLGVGVTSMNASFHVQGAATTDGSLSFNQQLASTTAYNSSPLSGTMVALKYTSGGSLAGMGGWAVGKENSTDGNYSSYLGLYTRANGGAIGERARIDSSGNLLVGSTSNTSSAAKLRVYQSDTANPSFTSEKTTTAVSNHVLWYNPNGAVGAIGTNGSTTYYNTSSDYRLKENIEPMTGALATVSQLKPVTYTWKTDGSAGQGFIAHELQAFVPDAVVGEKDAVDEEGKPIYQGIDTSFLVATLTAAIQEQQAIIQQLTARIETLEAK